MNGLIHAIAVAVVPLLLAAPAAAQTGGDARDFRDRPFGSMGTGSIMSSSGTDTALGTGGAIITGTGQGTAIGHESGLPKDLSGTGYRFSPTASPTNPRVEDAPATPR